MTSDEKVAGVVIGAAIAAAIAYAYFGSTSTSASSSVATTGIAGSLAGIGSDAGSAILGAISSFENVASQHNNPGGICGSFDSSGNCLGPATFSSYEEGAQAALSKIGSWISANPALSVAQFVEKWSGATGATLQNYIAHVSDALGLDPSDPISAATGVGELDDDSDSDGSAGFDSGDGVNF